MVASNKILDRFFNNKVIQQLYSRAVEEDVHSLRMFCKLSIVTSGTRCNRTEYFFNSPHIDKMDVLFQDFQVTAKDLLMEVRLNFSDDTSLTTDIQYLEDLSDL